MMMVNWTAETADEVYSFIRDYIRVQGYPPTIRNISDGCHMSRTNVIRYLDKLEAERRIRRDPGIPRGISLLHEDHE
jgi:repressor LexA